MGRFGLHVDKTHGHGRRPSPAVHAGVHGQYPDFTICHFPSQYSEALTYCGSHSGRDVDKIAECGLSPIPSSKVESPGFDEADLIIECSKMYFDDFKPEHFLAGFIEENYPAKDYHRLYLGEIKAASGTGQYKA